MKTKIFVYSYRIEKPYFRVEMTVSPDGCPTREDIRYYHDSFRIDDLEGVSFKAFYTKWGGNNNTHFVEFKAIKNGIFLNPIEEGKDILGEWDVPISNIKIEKAFNYVEGWVESEGELFREYYGGLLILSKWDLSHLEEWVGDYIINQKGLTVFTVNPNGEKICSIKKSRDRNRFYPDEFIISSLKEQGVHAGFFKSWRWEIRKK